MTARILARKLARHRRRVSPGSSFQAAALRRYGVASPQVDDPTVQMWLDFTLSSVERGRAAVAAMGGTAAFSGRRVLDVGCAYGGFLVAAAEAGAGAMTRRMDSTAGRSPVTDARRDIEQTLRLSTGYHRRAARRERF